MGRKLAGFLCVGLVLLVAASSLPVQSIASGIAAVTSVFGQTGAVNIPITTTDISTPAPPAAGHTKSYSKGGKWCSEDSASSENCTGSSGGPTTNQNIRTVGATFVNGGSVLGATTVCTDTFAAGTIQEADIIADQSGSATIDVKTVAFASYTGAASSSSIAAAAIPALSSAVKFSDTTLTGWTTAVSGHTVFCFAMTAPATITFAQILLKIAAN